MNPMAYTFKALFLNEMDGLAFPCVGHDLVPSGPGYTNATYQACAIAGHREVCRTILMHEISFFSGGGSSSYGSGLFVHSLWIPRVGTKHQYYCCFSLLAGLHPHKLLCYGIFGPLFRFVFNLILLLILY